VGFDFFKDNECKSYILTVPTRFRDTGYSQLPDFIEPVPLHITTDELHYLREKEALLLPNHKVQQELRTAYWKYAHPFIPVLDQTQMEQSIRACCGGKISLLLYQCIMLVGRLFLNAHESPCYEFTEAQEMMARIRALYDLGWETKPFTILQCLILMTFFPQKIDEPKGQAYFVGHAVSMAYRFGLHRDAVNLSIQAPSLYHLRKRLWWSLFIRERNLILDQGIPWMIDENDYDVPMITIDDFCLDPEHYDIQKEDPPFVKVSNVSRQRKIAIMWIEKAKLAVVMGKLPSISVHISEGNSGIFQRPWLQTGQLPDCQSLDHAGISLERWQGDASSEIDFAGSDSPASWVGDDQLYIQCATLKLLYHTVKFHLAVLRAFSSRRTLGVPPEHGTCQEASNACRDIIQMMGQLQLYGKSAQIPLYGTSILRPVLIWGILNGVAGRKTSRSSHASSDQLQRYDICRVDSYRSIFRMYLLLDET
jgi:hypothetical protein